MRGIIIDNELEIKKIQNRFEEKLKAVSSRTIPAKPGWKGGNLPANVHYSEKLDFWFYFDKLMNEPIPRYWNIFGLGKPKENSNLSIMCEINFPLRGTDLRVSGVIIRKDSGEVLVCHTGNIRGGRKDIGPKLFKEHYSGEWIDIGGKRLALVGYLDSIGFVQSVRGFVSEVNRIKNIAHPG